MALSARDRLRRDVQDRPQRVIETLLGDGKTTRFVLPQENIAGAVAYTIQSDAWAEVSGAVIGADGSVVMPTAVDGEIRVEFTFTAFSDSELDGILDEAGDDLLDAQIKCCEILMFDSLKRGMWRSVDGSVVDNRMRMDTLMNMHKSLLKQRERGALSYGEISSWGERQGQR